MAIFSRIVIVMVVVALSLLTSQNGVLGFRNRKLRTLSKTAQDQQKEASGVASSDPSFVAVSSEQLRKERTRLDFLNQEKSNELLAAQRNADESLSMLQFANQQRQQQDESMWSTLSSDNVRTGFQLQKNSPVVMPRKWQLHRGGVKHSSHNSNSKHPFTSELEMSTGARVNLHERIDAFMKGTLCWKDTTQRGIGTIPTSCTNPSNPSFDAGLCYAACNSNEHGVATMCIQNSCETGYTDYGLTCTYTAGALLVGKGCCCTVFGCCNVNCGYGYQDDGGCLCRAITYGITRNRGIGIIPTGCPSGQVNNAGLCYKQCPANYVGLATTCWQQCTGSTPVDCGAACATDTATCVNDVIDMVTGPLTIALNVVTGGEIGTALKSVGTVAMAAVEDGVEAMIKAAAERIADLAAKNLSTSGIAATITNMAKQAGVNLATTAPTAIASAAMQVYEGSSVTTTTLSAIASIDPTGIASTVIAYAHPLC